MSHTNNINQIHEIPAGFYLLNVPLYLRCEDYQDNIYGYYSYDDLLVLDDILYIHSRTNDLILKQYLYNKFDKSTVW